ncbi:LapA family protein [Fusibacter bizertensis]
MQIYIVLILIFAILVTLFAIFNASVVTVSLFFVDIDISLALVILGSVLIGAISVVLFDAVRKIKEGRVLKEINKKSEALEKQIAVKDEALKQRDQAIEERDKLIAQKDELIVKKDELINYQKGLLATIPENKVEEVENQ